MKSKYACNEKEIKYKLCFVLNSTHNDTVTTAEGMDTF